MAGQREVGLDGDAPGAVRSRRRSARPARPPAAEAVTPAAQITVRAAIRSVSPSGRWIVTPLVVDARPPCADSVDGHAEPLERALGLGATATAGSVVEHAVGGLDEQDAARGRVDRAGSRGAACRGRARRSGRPSPRRSGRRRRRRTSARPRGCAVGLDLGGLEGAEERGCARRSALSSDLTSAACSPPLLVAEVGVAASRRRRSACRSRAGSGDRYARRPATRCTSRASRSKSATSASSTRTLRAPLEDRAQRIGDLARRERAGRDLVGQRLEQVEVAPVDQRDLDRRAAQLRDGLQPAEAAADHDHAVTLSRR